MDAVARVTSKGQVTVPKSVREALDLEEGDSLVFHVEGKRAVVSKTLSLDELMGSVPIPPGKRGATWKRIITETRSDRAARRH
jgi:AbrB family looped-hinge helix DNA binding protein